MIYVHDHNTSNYASVYQNKYKLLDGETIFSQTSSQIKHYILFAKFNDPFCTKSLQIENK